jgi:small subunit ribosomal protein S21
MSRDKPKSTRKGGARVEVKDGNVDKALRKFKNKIQESGLLEEVRERMEYVKPCVRRLKDENQARRRWLRQVEKDELEGRRPSREGTRKRLF